MPHAADRYQVMANINTPEEPFWCSVGEAQETEANAWRMVHLTGCCLYPENAPHRRWFENRCKVVSVTRIPIG